MHEVILHPCSFKTCITSSQLKPNGVMCLKPILQWTLWDSHSNALHCLSEHIQSNCLELKRQVLSPIWHWCRGDVVVHVACWKETLIAILSSIFTLLEQFLSFKMITYSMKLINASGVIRNTAGNQTIVQSQNYKTSHI